MENEHKGGQDADQTVDSGLTLTLHRWQEDQRLARFFAKLVGEVTFVGADTIQFELSKDGVSGAILKAGKPLKSLTVKPVWFAPMCRWLQSRVLPFSPSNRKLYTMGTWVPCFRVGDHMVFFRASQGSQPSGTTYLELTDFSVVSYSKALEWLEMLPYVKTAFEEVFGAKSGVVLLMQPSAADWGDSLATALVFGGGSYLGDVTDAAVRAAARQLASEHLVFVSLAEQDTVEGLFRLVEWKESLPLSSVLGAASLASVPRVCSECVQRTAVDPAALQGLPPYFQKMSLDRYSVGRGCSECEQSGYSGKVGLQSVARMTEHLEHSLVGGQAQSSIMGYLHSRGTKPLLEDGIRKALAGVTTFEAVRSVSNEAPAGYVEYWSSLMAVEAELVGTQSSSHEPLGGAPRPRASESEVAPSPIHATSPLTQLQKPLVLVVEDDTDQRAILEMVLKGAQYDVAQAANGQEALTALEKIIPDLVIVDLMMPVMDGGEFVTRMKKEARLSDIPILMLTMVADEEKEYAMLALGADDYCDKTMQRKVLLKRVEKLLKRSRGRAVRVQQ